MTSTAAIPSSQGPDGNSVDLESPGVPLQASAAPAAEAMDPENMPSTSDTVGDSEAAVASPPIPGYLPVPVPVAGVPPMFVGQSVGKMFGGQASAITLNVFRKVMESRGLPPSMVEQIRDGFVPPRDATGHIWNQVETQVQNGSCRIVVLSADADCGRRFAAIRLLSLREDLDLKEIEGGSKDQLESASFATQHSTGWLLDYSDGTKIPEDLGRSLHGIGEVLRSHESLLVIVLPKTEQTKIQDDPARRLITLQRPTLEHLLEMVRRRLETEDTGSWLLTVSAWITFIRNKALLTKSSKPSDAGSLADTIIEAEKICEDDRRIQDDQNQTADFHGAETVSTQSEGGAAGADDETYRVKAMVLGSYQNWFNHLRDWQRNHQDSLERAFQLAAAVQQGATVGEIYSQASKLLVALGEGESDNAGLRGPGILQLLVSVEADLEHGNTLSFHRPGFADAVLDYFWVDRQHLQENFLKWLSSLVRQGERDDETTIAVINRIADYAVRWTEQHQDFSLVADVLRDWADDTRLHGYVYQLITALGFHHSLGKKARALIGDWSKGEKTKGSGVSTPKLRAVVAQVCGGELGIAYPRVAVQRLFWLFEKEQDLDLVKDEVSNLLGAPQAREVILSATLRLIKQEKPEARRRGAGLFALVASTIDRGGTPVLLGNSNEALADDRADYLAGWTAVLDEEDDDLGQLAFNRWADAAVQRVDLRRFIITTLAEAAGGEDGSRRKSFQLGGMLKSWLDTHVSSTSSGHVEVVGNLRDLIEPQSATTL